MGMLFNTKATTKMLQIVNDAFSSDNWAAWLTPDSSGVEPRELFSPANAATWPLFKIAKKTKIFGPDGEDKPKDKRWQKWLKELDRLGVSPDLRAQIYAGLSDDNVSEIAFVLIPSDTVKVAPANVVVGSTKVIMIQTVEVDHMAKFAAQQHTAVRTRRTNRRQPKKK